MLSAAGQSQHRPAPLHPFLPRFVDPKLERRYRDDRLEYRLHALRISCLAGIAIYVLFFSLDLLAIHDPSASLFYVRLIGTISLVPILVASFILKPGRWIETLGFVAIAIQIPLLTGVLAFMSPVSLPYYQPTELYIMLGVISFVLCGVSFVEGLILAFGTICAFFISAIAFWPEPPLVLAFHFAWLSAVIFVAAVGSFVLDRTQHTAWLQGLHLLTAEQQIRSLLHNVCRHPSRSASSPVSCQLPIDLKRPAYYSRTWSTSPHYPPVSTDEVVSMLGDLFSRFDQIIARHGLEKIKTIGDCYMVARACRSRFPDISKGSRMPLSKSLMKQARPAHRTVAALPFGLAYILDRSPLA